MRQDLAELIAREFGRGEFDVVYPSLSILTEFPVAIVEKVVEKKGTRKQAQAARMERLHPTLTPKEQRKADRAARSASSQG